MPTIEEQLKKKKPFKKRNKSLLSLDEPLEDDPFLAEEVHPSPKEEPLAADVREDEPFKKKSYRSYLSHGETLEDHTAEDFSFSEGDPLLPTPDHITEDKPETNRGRTGDKCIPGNSLIEDKAATNRGRTEDNKGVSKPKTEDKLGTKPRTLRETNRGQTEDKLETSFGISSLVGLQREILIFCYNSCKKTRSKSTEELALSNIAEALNTTAGSVKKTIQRLEGKSFLRRIRFKNGRGGWSMYHIPDDIYQDLLQLEAEGKLRTNRGRTEDELGTKLRTEPRTTPSSSSSIINNLNTTTTEEDKSDSNTQPLPPEWGLIDCEPLRSQSVPFGKDHLRQLFLAKQLSPSEVQESIHRFAFDLEKNEKRKSIRGDAIAFFMGVLRKGHSYTCPANYESPEDRKLQEHLAAEAAYLERKRNLHEKLEELEFEKWLVNLSPEKIRTLVPTLSGKIDTPLVRGALRNIFTQNEWPRIAQSFKIEIPKTPNSEIEEVRRIIDSQFGPTKPDPVSP